MPGSTDAFRLAAVIVHVGQSARSGHYYTYGRRPTGWYCFNDGAVFRCGVCGAGRGCMCGAAGWGKVQCNGVCVGWGRAGLVTFPSSRVVQSGEMRRHVPFGVPRFAGRIRLELEPLQLQQQITIALSPRPQAFSASQAHIAALSLN